MVTIADNALEFYPQRGLCGVWDHQHAGGDGRFVATVEHEIRGPLLETMAGQKKLLAPPGTRSDGASFPRWMWSLYHPMGPWARAAFWHDRLYRTQELGSDERAREVADQLFWAIMYQDRFDSRGREVIPWYRRWGFVGVLHVTGKRAWQANQTKIPFVRRETAANARWLQRDGLLIERRAV